jgi:hypothetical protein
MKAKATHSFAQDRVGESKRGRLVDPAKVSRGTVHLAASSALRFLISAKPPIFI